MGILRKTQEQPLTAATVRTFDRLPDRPNVTFQDSELWRLYRCVPEIHYAVNQQARLVGRLKWDVEANGQPIDDSDEVMRQTFGKQLRSVAVMAAIHLQVVGRYFLAHIPPPEGSDKSRYPGTWRILNNPHTHDQKALAEAADILVEVIIEDPADSKRADSAVMAVRDIATELLLARMQARRAARSRIAQLMTVLYPKEGAGPDPAKFEREWIQAASAPMADEKASESAVPNLIGWPAQYIEQIRTLDLTGPIDEKLAERIDRLIGQLAIGLDIAPSLLTGMEDSSHWTAWAAQEDNWLGHVEPLAAPVGESFAAGLAKAIRQNPDTIDITPDPAPLLKRRPAITDVLTAWEKGLVNAEWAREQLGAPESAAGDGLPEPTTETITVQQEANAEPSLEAGQRRQITQEATQAPTAAAVGAQGVEIDGARLADIDDQAYTSLQDLIADVAERILEKLGAKVRASLQGRDTDLPRDVSNAELARLYTGDIPNADQTIEQTARDAVAKVTRVVHRAQGRLRAAGIDVPESPPEDPNLIGAQEAFVAAVLGVVAAMRAGRPGVAEAWAAARAIATIAGGGEAQDFRNAASGIALAAATMAVIRRDHGLAPRTGPGSHRWLHLYQGPDPHPVHLSLKDALFNGVSVFAGGYEAFPGDHAGCECIAVPAELVRVDTGWRGNQP